MIGAFRKIGVACMLMLAISVALSACGRRGNPELPPSSVVLTTDEKGNEIKNKDRKVRDNPFILDPLI